jgi:hypothetical protein
MVETDVLARLVGFLQDKDSDIRRSSANAVTSLAKFGRLIYHLDCARADDPAADFCSNVLARLVGWLQDDHSDVRRSSVNTIIRLAKFGRLIYHSGLCEDW